MLSPAALLLTFPALLLSLPTVTKYSTRVVDTAYGSLRGIIISNPSVKSSTNVEAFLGVPYASAPAASLRFMPPLTPSHWTETHTADRPGPTCPQILPDTSNRSAALKVMPLLKYTRLSEVLSQLKDQSEDCLYLNIYLPAQDFSNLAILVILQGGESWEWGSGNLIDGSALAAEGRLMVIVLSHRTGPLGFLQTATSQGNYGFMDVVAGLNWIKENAAYFGGDSNRVTLLGHRTGAVLANLLLLAPVANELFHRVVLLSGSVLSPWSLQRFPKANVRVLGNSLRCELTPSETPSPSILKRIKGPLGVLKAGAFKEPDLGPCLRERVTLEELLNAANINLTAPRFLSRFGPLVDGSVVRNDLQIGLNEDGSGPGAPGSGAGRGFAAPAFARIPLLLGFSSVESFDELNTEDIEDGLSESKRDRILRTLVRNLFVFHLNEIFSTVRNEYVDWERPRPDFIDVRDSVLGTLSDATVIAPLISIAAEHSRRSSASPNASAAGKTFLLHFAHEPDHSIYPQRLGSISDDLRDFSLGHAILHQRQGLPPFSETDTRVGALLVNYLANFVISGDPNEGPRVSTAAEKLPFWEPFEPINQLYMEMGSEGGRVKGHYRSHKLALWLNLIPQLHRSGGADVPSMTHHNFREERKEYYEGIVREQSKNFPAPETPPTPPINNILQHPGIGGQSEVTDEEDDDLHIPGDEDYDTSESLPGPPIPKKSPVDVPIPFLSSTTDCPPNSTVFDPSLEVDGQLVVTSDGSSVGDGDDRSLIRQLAASHYKSYGAALGVTIGVGCCLLLLNLLIFLAIYHQKINSTPIDRQGREEKGLAEDDEGGGGGVKPSSEGAFQFGDEFFCNDDEFLKDPNSFASSYLPTGSTHTTSGDPDDESPGSSIPEPPPPPRSVPPSTHGSTHSIASGGSGILRRPPPPQRSDSTGSIKKRVQIQEIRV